MHVNFYKKPRIHVNNPHSKTGNGTLFLEYLSEFIANSATKRVKGYGTVGLAHNTIRTIHHFTGSLRNMNLRNLRNYTSVLLIKIPRSLSLDF